jgi:hypothetical protein
MTTVTWKDSGLLPYGLLPTLATINDTPPADWRGAPADFVTWREGMLTLIQEKIWPVSDPAVKSWVGNSAAFLREITLADLRILHAISADGPLKLLNQLPASPLRHLGCPLHQAFYDAEDGGTAIADPRKMYDRQSDADTFLTPIGDLFSRGRGRKSTLGMIYWLKRALQRPRPFQCGLWLDVSIKHEGARSGLHPAMISGHCLQGMASLAGIAERLLMDRAAVSQEQWSWIRRICADFGDRRVMAGVHFPSDNLASWIVMLDLCQHVVDGTVLTGVKQQISEAIRTSEIYRRIIIDMQAGGSHYGPAVGALHDRMVSGLPVPPTPAGGASE